MILPTTRAPSAPGDAALRAMFAARKQVFVDLLKWDVPVLDERYEVDQFDTPEARYLILLDSEGRHHASARLLPTVGPHLLGDFYPHLCEGDIPAGPAIREISRFCLDLNLRSRERRRARDQLVTALAAYALRQGITDYTGVAEPAWLECIMEFGWACEPLGAQHPGQGSGLAALRIRIDGTTVDGLKRAGIYAPLSLHLEEGGGRAT